MRGGCAPLVCDDKVGRTFCNFCSLLRRVLRGVARTLAWMCILFGSVLRGHRKSLVNYSVLCKLNCCECPFLTVPSNFPIIPVIILLTCPPNYNYYTIYLPIPCTEPSIFPIISSFMLTPQLTRVGLRCSTLRVLIVTTSFF